MKSLGGEPVTGKSWAGQALLSHSCGKEEEVKQFKRKYKNTDQKIEISLNKVEVSQINEESETFLVAVRQCGREPRHGTFFFQGEE